MKWVICVVAAILCFEVMEVKACSKGNGKECVDFPTPVGRVTEIIISPFRPLLNVIGSVLDKILSWRIVNWILAPIRFLIKLVLVPLKVIRWLVYLPMNLLLIPFRILGVLLKIKMFILRVLTFIPRKIVSAIIGIFTSPFVLISRLIKLPFYLISKLISFIHKPGDTIKNVIHDILHFPYLHIVPALILIWIITAPIGWLFDLIFC